MYIYIYIVTRYYTIKIFFNLIHFLSSYCLKKMGRGGEGGGGGGGGGGLLGHARPFVLQSY